MRHKVKYPSKIHDSKVHVECKSLEYMYTVSRFLSVWMPLNTLGSCAQSNTLVANLLNGPYDK